VYTTQKTLLRKLIFVRPEFSQPKKVQKTEQLKFTKKDRPIFSRSFFHVSLYQQL